MKQFGLAVHNFHDTRNALPALVIRADYATAFLFILPYMEQQAIHSVIASLANGEATNFKQNVAIDSDLWGWEDWTSESGLIGGSRGINDAKNAFKKGICSIPIHYCPTRRSGGKATNGTLYEQNDWIPWGTSPSFKGPATDYAFVALRTTNANPFNPTNEAHYKASIWNSNRNRNPGEESDVKNYERGALRVAVHPIPPSYTTGNYATNVLKDFTHRDDVSWWQDGTSNQLLLSEKHIPLGQHLYLTGADSTWLYSEGSRCTGGYRVFYSGIQRPSDHQDRAPQNNVDHIREFGSWHPGVCGALLGDGSVRSLSITTPTLLLLQLSHVSDGTSVSVP